MRWDNVLVTGGSGRLGRHVVAELRDRCDVTVLDRESPADSGPHVTADVLDEAAVANAMQGIHAVVHLAAIDSGTPATEHDYFHVAAQGTWNVLAAAETAGARRAVVCSSCAAYGLEFFDPRARVEYLPLDEAHPLRPLDAYALGKQVVETVARSFARRGRLDVICLRPAWIMFPDKVLDFEHRARVLDGSRGCAEEVKPLPMLRPWVRPDDTARCFRLALESEHVGFDVFNVGARDSFSPAPTLEVVSSALGATPALRDAALYGRFPRAAAFGAERAERVLGWRPTGDWPAYVAEIRAEPRAEDD